MHSLFTSKTSNAPVATGKNSAGGVAYKLSSTISLAKYACTGCFADTYASNATDQLDRVLSLCSEVEPEFLAKLAVYSRRHAAMKDVPSLILSYLAHKDINLCRKIFPKVIDSMKLCKNFVQVMRSGVLGSKSLGTASKKLVQNYLNNLTDEQLFKADVGNAPSLPDIIKLTHPKPSDKPREALYAYLLGKQPKNHDKDYLLPLVHEFEAFKKGASKTLPGVPFEMLTALPLTEDNWCEIARNATFTQTRINLNTFQRHGVFKHPELVKIVADKLANHDNVIASKVMPYQLFTTFMHTENMPQEVHNSLNQAMEMATENVPVIEGNVVIGLDVSGSMSHKITGNRGSATTKARFVDVASLFASALLRKNKNAKVLPFDTEVRDIAINPFDSIMTNAQKLAIRGGGTDCAQPAIHIVNNKLPVDVFILISDNESWRAYGGKKYRGQGTGLMEEWAKIKKANPHARMINIDISPSDTSQTPNAADTLLISGYSDAVTMVISDFLREGDNKEFWLTEINSIKL